MEEGKYNEIMDGIRESLSQTTRPIQRINTKKMSSKEKDEKIKELEEQVRELQSHLQIRTQVYDRYIQGLLEIKYNQTMELINNPILTLPSGAQIQFSSLNSEQLEYLESLSVKQNKL